LAASEHVASSRVEDTQHKIRGILNWMARTTKGTDLLGLESLALQQGGYFDRGDAHTHGIGDDLLSHHTRRGRFERIFPGVYRLKTAPISHLDDLRLAWVWSNYRGAISHESALALYDLSDVMPSRVHLTVPASFRRESAPFELHRARLQDDEVTTREGLAVTTPARSIVDAAADGTGPEQIQLAAQQAIERALASPEQILRAARRPGYRHRRTVLPLIEAAVDRAPA
jgi:predicted transcriptional regulator of viral defense system